MKATSLVARFLLASNHVDESVVPRWRLAAEHLARVARELCDACLAAAVNLTPPELLQVTFELEGLPGFRVRYYWCAECRRRDRVIGIDRDDAPKAFGPAPPAVHHDRLLAAGGGV